MFYDSMHPDMSSNLPFIKQPSLQPHKFGCLKPIGNYTFGQRMFLNQFRQGILRLKARF